MKLLFATILFSCSYMHVWAGAGKEAVLTGVSSNGHAKLEVKIWDVSDLVSKAELIVEKDTMEFVGDCDVFKIIEPANHVFVLHFQQKGTNQDSTGAKTLQLWAMPTGFECKPGSSVNCKFRAKVLAVDPDKRGGDSMELKLNCTFEWNP